jgi:hypothetical protein
MESCIFAVMGKTVLCGCGRWSLATYMVHYCICLLAAKIELSELIIVGIICEFFSD